MDTGIRQYDNSCMFLAQGTAVVLFKCFPLRLSAKNSAYSALKIHFPAKKKAQIILRLFQFRMCNKTKRSYDTQESY